ncbi:hypothetical protein [Christiangramia forsetii]|uniref:Uncharacterized protein n=2 Tax=Christiangramia forsetii TaxID=411153 RepID=A0LY04_CHRFK|nr:hypothetical protein [Christiangramia forsetii]GGG35339.1 hypothetical protein GCM10011532_18920 [Christiangramia forsetii]CAL65249.1 hypothetical protein GFO_0263 [Christiangramia forsetii KT0803]
MSFIPAELNIFSELNPSRTKGLYHTDVIDAINKNHEKAENDIKQGNLHSFQEHILMNHVYYLQYFDLSNLKLCIEEHYKILKKTYPADNKKVFIKTEFEHYITRLKQLREAFQEQNLQVICNYGNFDFYFLERGLSSYTICWKVVSRDSYVFYEDYLNRIIDFLEKEFFENDMHILLEDDIPQIELNTSNMSEKIVYLEELGVIDFLKSLEPFNTSTNALAHAVSSFTGIKPSTVQSYLNPMNNSTLNQKNNPLTKKRLEKIRLELEKIGFDPN